MPTQFTLEYAMFVFVAVTGVTQFVASVNRLDGLLFYRKCRRAYAALALFAVVGAFIWFFADNDRNQPDTGLGLDGNNQAFWFTMSTLASVTITMTITSALHHRWGARKGLPWGIDALGQTTLFLALLQSLRKLRGRSN